MNSDEEKGLWPDWEGSGFPREYGIDEKVPLQEPGVELGMGRFGDVDLVRCGGIELARKRIRVGARLQEYLRDGSHETRIMRKLRHEHIVRFAGSYIQGNTLGILVWPVAACNLGQLLRAGVSQLPDPTDTESCRVWDLLQLDSYHFEESRPDGTVRAGPHHGHIILRRMFGCISAALEYLHEQGIRHKDIKPDNILATRNSVYLSDFGVSTDVSRLIQNQGFSMTEGPTAGTARYFSPEAAKYLPRGRKSDIFSLGCVFLEMLAVMSGMPLDAINLHFTGEREPITGMRYYEHTNDISRLLSEIQARPGSGIIPGDLCLMLLEMLQEDPERRPSADTVVGSLASYKSELAIVHCQQCAKPAVLFANQRRSEINYSDFELVIHHLPRYWWFVFAVHFLSYPMEWLIIETVISLTTFSTPTVPLGHAYFAIDLAVLGITEQVLQTLHITPNTVTCSVTNYCFTQAKRWLPIFSRYVADFLRNDLHSALANAFEWLSSLASTTIVSAPSLINSALSTMDTALSSAIALELPSLKTAQFYIYTALSALDRFLCVLDNFDPCSEAEAWEWGAQLHNFSNLSIESAPSPANSTPSSPLKAAQSSIYTAVSALDRFLCVLDNLDPCPGPQEGRTQVHQYPYPSIASNILYYIVVSILVGFMLFYGFRVLAKRHAHNLVSDSVPFERSLIGVPFVYFFLLHFYGGLVWIVGFVAVEVIFMIYWVFSHSIEVGVALLPIFSIGLIIFFLSLLLIEPLGLCSLLLLGGLVWSIGFLVVGVVSMIYWVVSHLIGSGVALLTIFVWFIMFVILYLVSVSRERIPKGSSQNDIQG